MHVPTEFQINMSKNKEIFRLFPHFSYYRPPKVEDLHTLQSTKFSRKFLKTQKVKKKNHGRGQSGRIFRKVLPHLKCGHCGFRRIGVSVQG
jgi:hypothetical protein